MNIVAKIRFWLFATIKGIDYDNEKRIVPVPGTQNIGNCVSAWHSKKEGFCWQDLEGHGIQMDIIML